MATSLSSMVGVARLTSFCWRATVEWSPQARHESKESCLKGIDAVKRLAADAVVIEEPAKAAKVGPATKAAPSKK